MFFPMPIYCLDSINQVVHFLTPRHLAEASLFTHRQRDIEIHTRAASALIVGVPPHNFSSNFKQAAKKR